MKEEFKKGADKSEEVRHNDNEKGNKPMNNQLLSIEQVSKQLNLGKTTIQRLVRENRLKSVQVGSRRLYKPSFVFDFINSLTESEHEYYGY